MGIVILLSRNTITGFGVNRGRLPGATEEGCRGSAHDWEPREEGAKPVPGMTMVSLDTSLGLMEIALPQESTTPTNDVSKGPSSTRVLAVSGDRSRVIRNGSGMAGDARSARIEPRRSFA